MNEYLFWLLVLVSLLTWQAIETAIRQWARVRLEQEKTYRETRLTDLPK